MENAFIHFCCETEKLAKSHMETFSTLQGDHFSETPRNIVEFDSCLENVRETVHC